jgi:hypothetical protein
LEWPDNIDWHDHKPLFLVEANRLTVARPFLNS